MNYDILKNIKSPTNLNNIENLEELCAELRHKMMDVVSKNGGHLASSLGAVELTVALHKVFNNKNDKFFWDVGHQTYAHKMLTGRFEKFDTLRTEGGISGFPNRFESVYDPMTCGHSSTSISAALGHAWSNKIQNIDAKVVAIIGDGALTGGLAYEGLNNAGKFPKNFIIVLNDNKMSISKNVGAVARILTAARLAPAYRKFRGAVESVLEKTPVVGEPIKDILVKSKTAIKNWVYRKNIFEDMGFAYYGPINGHDLAALEKTLKMAKEINGPVVVHIFTQKGKGYAFAEKNSGLYHGVSKFNLETGLSDAKKPSFSDVFGETLCELAKTDPKICAITAAMPSGTGLSNFKSKFKNRFFDVGIAEGHAVTFCGGLCSGGMKPVFAVYSSFLQRCYGQLIHDLALQKFGMILGIDRAGLVGEDGETHQGIFDVAFLNTIPNMEIYAPSYFEDLQGILKKAVNETKGKVIAIRYPRGGEMFKSVNYVYSGKDFDFFGGNKSNILIITYGRIFGNAFLAAQRLGANIIKLNKVKPLPLEALVKSLKFKKIFFFEEGIKYGGVAEKFGAELLSLGFAGSYKITAINDEFVPHATVEAQFRNAKLDAESIAALVNASVCPPPLR